MFSRKQIICRVLESINAKLLVDGESPVRSDVELRVNASLPCYGAFLQLRARRVLNSNVKLDTRLIILCEAAVAS